MELTEKDYAEAFGVELPEDPAEPEDVGDTEPQEGAPDAAKALADRLAKQYNLRWEPLSKFARANALK